MKVQKGLIFTLTLGALSFMACSHSSSPSSSTRSLDTGVVSGTPSAAVTSARLASSGSVASLAISLEGAPSDIQGEPFQTLYHIPGTFSSLQTYRAGTGSRSFVLASSYRLVGSTLTSTPAGGSATTETFDSEGRLTRSASGAAYTYTAAPSGAPRFVRFASMMEGANLKAKWEQSGSNWVFTFYPTAGSTSTSKIWRYDSLGRCTSLISGGVTHLIVYTDGGDSIVNFSQAVQTGGSTTSTTYSYDPSERTLLVSQLPSGGGTACPQTLYRYNSNGYILEKDTYSSCSTASADTSVETYHYQI